MADKDLKQEWREYPHQAGFRWKEDPSGIIVIIPGMGVVGHGRILWRTIRAALKRKDKKSLYSVPFAHPRMGSSRKK